MRITILILLCLLSQKSLFSQDDSEINPIRLKDSTDVIQLLREAKTSSSRKDKNRLVENALELSRKLSYANGITQCLAMINSEYQKGDDALKALNYALEEMHSTKPNTERYYRMSVLIARIYLDYGSHKKALEYFNIAEKNLIPSVKTREKAILYEQIGDANAGTGQDIEANRYYNLAIELLNSYEAEQRILEKIANNYLHLQKFEQAILTFTYIKENAEKLHKKTDFAIAANNIATIYHSQNNYAKAIPFFEDALKGEKNLPASTLSVLYANLGIAYQNTGNTSGAITYLNKALISTKSLKKDNEEALIQNILAKIYLEQKDYFNAQKYNSDAEKTTLYNVSLETKAEVYHIAALIYQQTYEYEKAFEYYKKYLDLKESISLNDKATKQELERQVYLLEKQEKELQLSLINKDIQELNLNQLRLQSEKLKLEAEKKEDELKLLKQAQDVNATTLINKELEALQAKQKLDLVNQSLAAIEKDKRLADLKQKQQLQLVELARQRAETQQNLQAISLLTKDKELLTVNNELLSKDAAIKELELSGQRNFQRTAYGIGLLLLAITALIIRGLYLARRNNKLLSQKNQEIEASRHETEIERQKAETLLLNILPDETAAELKAFGAAIPRHYDKVSVLFTDFSNFTQISQKMSPEELISELNECFVAFDEIIDKHGLEKIKTIGDAYMCAGGIPTANDSNPYDTVAAAIDLQAFMKSRNEMKKRINQSYFQMRVGIHTGEVIAGVVGKNKFAYDIWGDTVNLASRLESTCPTGEVNISEATFQFVKDKYQCAPRGEIEAKGKGKVLMYLVSPT
jgi:class 3 adenylate cyclase/tetratricopeptide (TPR) repeat protein